MRCFICKKPTERNEMDHLNEEQQALVEREYVLIAIDGPADMFDADGYVIICRSCVEKVPMPHRLRLQP